MCARGAGATLDRLRLDPDAPHPPPRPSIGGGLDGRTQDDAGRHDRDLLPLKEDTGTEPLMPSTEAARRGGGGGRKKRATGAKAMAAMAGAFAAASKWARGFDERSLL